MVVKVVVDASQGALGPCPAANRAMPVYLYYMDLTLMLSIPEHADLWKNMDNLGLTSNLKASFGSCPLDIEMLKVVDFYFGGYFFPLQELSVNDPPDQVLVKVCIAIITIVLYFMLIDVNRLMLHRISNSMYHVGNFFAEYPRAEEAFKPVFCLRWKARCCK